MTPMLPAWVYEVTPGAVGIYSLLVVVVVALIKAWPVLSLQATAAREKLRAEGRSDLTDCQRRMDELQKELEAVQARVHKLDMKLLGAISAYRILDAEVELTNPLSAALKQARIVMNTAFELSPSTGPPIELPEGFI